MEQKYYSEQQVKDLLAAQIKKSRDTFGRLPHNADDMAASKALSKVKPVKLPQPALTQ